MDAFSKHILSASVDRLTRRHVLFLALAFAGTICFAACLRCSDQAGAPYIEHEETIATASKEIEQELRKWKPDHEDLVPTIGAILRPNIEVEGEWRANGTLDCTLLLIRKKESGGYSVGLATGGCLSSWALERVGTYHGGVINLSKPVMEYRPHTYDTLYAISVDETDYLISQSGIRSIVECHAKNGEVDWSEHVRFHAFHKAKEDRR